MLETGLVGTGFDRRVVLVNRPQGSAWTGKEGSSTSFLVEWDEGVGNLEVIHSPGWREVNMVPTVSIWIIQGNELLLLPADLVKLVVSWRRGGCSLPGSLPKFWTGRFEPNSVNTGNRSDLTDPHRKKHHPKDLRPLGHFHTAPLWKH